MGPLSRWHLQMGHMRVRMQLPGDPPRHRCRESTGPELPQGPTLPLSLRLPDLPLGCGCILSFPGSPTGSSQLSGHGQQATPSPQATRRPSAECGT